MADELYRKYRPTRLKDFVGQESAVKVVSKFLKNGNFPHAVLLTGPSGCGKTTLARLLAPRLNCEPDDFVEVNGADKRGVDLPREISRQAGMYALGGKDKNRIFLIDECHQLNSTAQNLFLKVLEDTPDHVYFFLATTDPQNLLTTIKTRCTPIKLESIDYGTLKELVESIVKKEDKELSEEVIEKIAKTADGSARQALVILHQVIDLDSEEEQMEAIENASHQEEAIKIARALISPKTQWKEMAQILKDVKFENSEVEGLRYMILGYCSSILLNGGHMCERAAMVIDFFSSHMYDSKKAGFIAACYEVVARRK